MATPSEGAADFVENTPIGKGFARTRLKARIGDKILSYNCVAR
nr:hypothetical protein [Haliscomenobacter sp.]